MYKPYMINDLYFQRLLWDRRLIYAVLKRHHIPIPPHLTCEREKKIMMMNETVEYTDPKDIQFKTALDKIYFDLFSKLLDYDASDSIEITKACEEDEILSNVRFFV